MAATPAKIKLDLALTPSEVDKLVHERTDGKTITPTLLTRKEIAVLSAYKRFRDVEKKSAFRQQLLDSLHSTWHAKLGEDAAGKLLEQFMQLTTCLDKNGAVIFGELINNSSFAKLVERYDGLMASAGSKSWIHSYINLANHPEFLTHADFSEAFLHPLLVALVAYRAGGPIRLVDARGKDAGRLSIKAQDNMLHIDNTPFNDEAKIIVTWEQHKASGPKGQNFVFLPGTHHGARGCFIDEDGKAWSTENASVFITDETVDQVFIFQKEQGLKPSVVEVTHDTKPTTTVFLAGSLVHHRYRRDQGQPRSCMILAMHLATDNPGAFMAREHVAKIAEPGSITDYLFGSHGHKDETSDFISAIVAQAGSLAHKIGELYDEVSPAIVIDQHHKALATEELEAWKLKVTSAPTVEDKKQESKFFRPGIRIPADSFQQVLVEKMIFLDKHGPLDLILYEDAHEEIRKWARNRIREAKVGDLKENIRKWMDEVKNPETEDLLSPIQLQEKASELAHFIDNLPAAAKANAHLGAVEKIASQDAYRSLRQLVVDLGEAIVRCDNRQTFLSTCLFLFLACDQLSSLLGETPKEVKEIGTSLLHNYVASYVIVEKHIVQCRRHTVSATALIARRIHQETSSQLPSAAASSSGVPPSAAPTLTPT